jgi:hypothetical protein
MPASDYLENKLLDHIVGKASFTMPSPVYVALCTTTPTDASTGSTLVEANYTGYARKSVPSADWGTASSGNTSNANAITFAACTGGTSSAQSFAICDALTGGNVLVWGVLGAALSISNGITPAFNAGQLIITAD